MEEEGDGRNDNDDNDKAGHEKERVGAVGNDAEASNVVSEVILSY